MTSKVSPNSRNGFQLSRSPSHLLRRCVQHASDLFSREYGASDLTRQQFTVLAAIEKNGGLSQTELVAITGIDRSTLAEMIPRMREKGMLERRRTETDKRANAVYITVDGRKALRSARAANDRVERMLLSGLPATDRARLVKMLALIASSAETDQPRTD